MRLDVAFVPTLRAPIHDASSTARLRLPGRNRQLCIVVDVIRASTSLVTLVDRGASRVFIAGDIDSARAAAPRAGAVLVGEQDGDRKSTRLNSSHVRISYAVFCLKKKN